MQENEFEKSVQQKMEEFALVPNDLVWKQVEARIKNEKRRRFIFFWLLAAVLFVGGISTWALLTNENRKEATTTYATKNNSATNKMIENDTNKRTTVNASLAKENNNKNTQAKSKEILKAKVYSVNRPGVSAQEKHDASNQIREQFAISKRHKEPTNKEYNTGSYSTLVQPKVNDINRDEAMKDLPLHKYYKLAEATQPDSLQNSLTANKQRANADTSKTKNLNTTSAKNKKGWKLGFTAFGGSSNNVGGINLFPAKSVNQFYSNSSALQSATSPSSALGPLKYKSSSSFGVGAFVSKDISNRGSITIGLDYYYYSARLSVGREIDSSLNIYDTVLQKQTSIASFYKQGGTTNFNGSYHLIQLPVNFLFRITKGLKAPVLSFGITPSLLVASNALYLNTHEQVYYREKKQFNRFLLFGQSGLLFQLHNFSKSQLVAGPVIQYDFNSVSRWQTNTHQHLISAGIKANITFK